MDTEILISCNFYVSQDIIFLLIFSNPLKIPKLFLVHGLLKKTDSKLDVVSGLKLLT